MLVNITYLEPTHVEYIFENEVDRNVDITNV